MDQETDQRSVLNALMSPAASMTADATIAIIAEEGFDRVSVRSVAAYSMGVPHSLTDCCRTTV